MTSTSGTKSKKYEFRVLQNETTWTAEIIRHASKRKIMVSKSQQGFATEQAAQQWGETELKCFLAQQVEKNKKHDLHRESKA